MTMKFPIILSAAALFGHATAFYGKMAATDLSGNEGVPFQDITLTDYNTGSSYTSKLWGGFKYCTTYQCPIGFYEITAGGYTFEAKMWRTSDGCHNIDFEGALDSHHVYCCGSLPCDFTA